MAQISFPQLPYPYNALEPYISQATLTLHHTKHHKTYVDEYNKAVRSYAGLAGNPQAARLQISLLSSIKFNGGGHLNHSLFWANLAPSRGGGGHLSSRHTALQEAFLRDFGSVDRFKQEFNTLLLAIQGSGWGWYVYNIGTKRTEIITLSNEDPVLHPFVPIIGIDMWEHSYYLQYKNGKYDYITNIWNIINYEEGERRLREGLAIR